MKFQWGYENFLSTDITAVEIAELLAIALSQGTLPQRVAKIAGEIIQEYIGDGGIRVNGGILNHFTLDAMGIYVDGQLITDDEQTVSATGLNPSSASHSIQSSFEEKFSTSLDLILTSDVFFNFEPFGIELWSYEKEIVEVPIPILPETELNSLDFVSTPDIITFPVETEEVPIANNAPEPVGTISQQTVRIGDANTKIDLSDKFADPDGDTLTFSVATSNPSVLTTQRVGNELTLIPWSAGSATITITATDPHGLTATQTFTVTVLLAEPTTVNRAPTAVGSIAEQSLFVGGFSRTIDVSSYFRDPDGDTLTYTAVSDNTSSVSTEVLADSRIRITPGANGSATVTVTASDGSLSATQRFSVIVSTLLIIGNRSPVAQGTINIQTLEVGDPSTTIDLSGYFRDPDGDTLTYTVTVSDANVLTAQRTGTSSVRLTPTGDGSTTVTVTASDGRLSVTQTFSVTVEPSDVDTSESSDVVVENISADYVTNYPGERYTVSVTVRNAGGRSAPNVRLRYYLSDDETYSTDDEEYEDLDDLVGSLRSGDSRRESVNLDAPSEEGVYYIIARTDPVENDQTSRNNYQSIKITVLPPAAPDLVVSLVAERYTVDPERRIVLDATVRNQGAEDASDGTTVRFYSSTDSIISNDDVEIGSESINRLRDGRSDTEGHFPLSSEQPGTYYFYARVDPVDNERITDNNISNVVSINVRGPDLVIASAYAEYWSSSQNTVDPVSSFSIYATVRNDGTDRSRSTDLQYYLSTDAILSSDDPEVGVSSVSRLSIGESSEERVHGIQPLSTSGFFYLFVCVETDENDIEINTDNNCSAPIKITVINRPPRSQGTIAPQMLDVGTPFPLNVSTYFTDRNNDMLTYTANSSDNNIATAVAVGAQITITPKRAGTATITVTAQDSEFTATQTFVVSVTGTAITEETWMPDANLRALVRLHLPTLPQDQPITKEEMAKLTKLTDRIIYSPELVIKDITGLEHATYLTEIVFEQFDHQISNIRPLQNLTKLTHVSMSGNQISDITPLQNLTKLRILLIGANQISDITPLQNLTELDHIRLYRNQISDITPLQNLTKLKYLLFHSNEISDISPLTGLTSLESLDLRSNEINDISPLAGLTSLGFLALSANQISDISPLAALTALEYLWIDSNQINNVSPIENMTALTSLQLSGNPITDYAPLRRLQAKTTHTIDIDIDIGVDPDVPVTTDLPEETWMPDANLRAEVREALGLQEGKGFTQEAMQRLKRLEVDVPPEPGPYKRINDLTGLEYATQLTELSLTGHSFSDISALSGLTQLTQLDLTFTGVTDISALSGLTQLTQLDLAFTGVTDISALSGLAQLTQLNLSWTYVVDIGPLQNLRELDDLILGNNKISDIRPLENLTALTSLQLSGNPITDYAPLRRLQAKTTQTIDIDVDIDIPDDPVITNSPEETWMPDANLRAAVRSELGLTADEVLTQQAMQRLTRLSAGKSSISDITGLEYATLLQTLDLYRNSISDISAVSGLTSLTWLSLGGNSISDISAVSGLTSLTDLYLHSNSISDISAVSGLTSLTALGLSGNSISDISAVSGLTSLTWLSLRGNSISDISAVSGLTSLTSLFLISNSISDVSPLEDLTALTDLYLSGNPIADYAPLRRLQAKTTHTIDIDIDIGVDPDVPVTTDSPEETWMPDANLRAKVRSTLGLAPGQALTQQAMQRLTSLSARESSISDITGLEYATQLQILDLLDNQISDLTPLEGLTTLTWLQLIGNQISDISALADLTALKLLYIAANQISDISALADLTGLTDANLSTNQISDISPLAGLTALTGIYLDRNQISDVSPLAGLTGLTWLVLWNNQISDISPLAGLTKLTDLPLSQNQIRDISSLNGLTKITFLGLARNQISDVSPLRNLTALQILHLNENQITDVSPLEDLTSLETLSIGLNPITDYAPLRRLQAKTTQTISIDVGIGAAPEAQAAKTALLPNYPNPFNPETWIPYQLAKPADVTLTIYNVEGVMVRQITLGHRDAGVYHSRNRAAHWDGKNNLGEKVAAGLYFVKFRAGNYTSIRKMLIRK